MFLPLGIRHSASRMNMHGMCYNEQLCGRLLWLKLSHSQSGFEVQICIRPFCSIAAYDNFVFVYIQYRSRGLYLKNTLTLNNTFKFQE